MVEWNRRQREIVVEQILAMSPEAQDRLTDDLLTEMEKRDVHPTLRKRLQSSGWQHPVVIQ